MQVFKSPKWNGRIQFIGFQSRRSNLPKKCLNRLSSGSAGWLAVSIKCMAGDRWSLYRKRAPLPVLYRKRLSLNRLTPFWLLVEREGFLSKPLPLPVLYRKRGSLNRSSTGRGSRSTGTSAGWASPSGGSAGWALKALLWSKIDFPTF